MPAYYNENDAFCVQWLKNLIAAGLIAPGDVDDRDIRDVQPADLVGYEQCHFFAGIGGWSAALRLAGWPDGRVVWTGSCPCQPFSSAGTGGGKDDARHLWPQFRRLLRQCRPAVVFGEQVASTAGRIWLSAVFADLEALAYRAAGADLCAPSVGAFDIRQRLWFVADTDVSGLPRARADGIGSDAWTDGRDDVARCGEARGLEYADSGRGRRDARADVGAEATRAGTRRCFGRISDGAEPSGAIDELADSEVTGRRSRWGRSSLRRRAEPERSTKQLSGCGDVGELGDASSAGLQERISDGRLQREAVGTRAWQAVERGGDVGFWAGAEWIPCGDGKWRPIEPGSFPLAHGVSGRMVVRRTAQQAEAEVHEEHWYSRTGALRGFGNAIKPQVAAAFIEAYRDLVDGT